MDKLNKYYYDILLCTSITYFINMLLTIKMINDNYHSNSTISCFIFFIISIDEQFIIRGMLLINP